MNNFDMMKRRLEYQGGIKQEDRMIHDKYKTFLSALSFSYQAADISLAQNRESCLSAIADAQPSGPIFRALINPDKLKQSYDDKILSVDRQHNFKCGDVIRWEGTDSYWIIHLAELTEDAYLRSEIRRCRYKIKFRDEKGNWFATWAAIRGPVETQIDSIQKNQTRVDCPNLSLSILMPCNDQTLKAFDRYSEFLFAGRSWKVQAPDSISMEDVIEINAEESYIDRDTDDVSNEIKNGLVIEPEDPTPESAIHGETWIKPCIPQVYISDVEGTWEVEVDIRPGEKLPITLAVDPQDNKRVTVTWNKMSEGQFDLYCGDLKKTIVVESLW